MCDEMERSLHDALCVVKRVLESKSVVPGGGAVEAALSIYLENYATSMVSRCWWGGGGHILCFGFVVKVVLDPISSCTKMWPSPIFIPSGFPRTVGYCRVCSLSPHHPQDAGCERSTGLHRSGGQAPGLPQWGSGQSWPQESQVVSLSSLLSVPDQK